MRDFFDDFIGWIKIIFTVLTLATALLLGGIITLAIVFKIFGIDTSCKNEEIKCIKGIEYIVHDTGRSCGITPAIDSNGKPIACEVK